MLKPSVISALGRKYTTAWQLTMSLLLATLLAQNALAFLTAPVTVDVVQGGSTVKVLLCNLKGHSYTDVEYPEFATDDTSCAALELSHIVGTALLSCVTPQVAPFNNDSIEGTRRYSAPLAKPARSSNTSRAPPVTA